MEKFPSFFYKFIFSLTRISELREKMQKVLKIFNAKSLMDLYLKIISSQNPFHHDLVLIDKFDEKLKIKLELINSLTDEEQLMFWDLIFYLPNDVLTKVDRATMSCSLEARAPFLDHEIVEFGLNLNKDNKILRGEIKVILRNILKKYLTHYNFNKPKSGFTVPLKLWLDGPLKEWTNDLLNENKIKNENFLNFRKVKCILKEHEDGIYNHQYQIWNILMFQSWLDDLN